VPSWQIEALEGKIKDEMTTLKTKIHGMEEEMVVYSDLERLRADAEERRRALETQREELGVRRSAADKAAQEAQKRHAELAVRV